MEIKVGVCETCKHYYEDYFDPSPSGVALPPGQMMDAGCVKEEELYELEVTEDIDIENIGKDEEHQCPLWQPAFQWCKRHKRWYLNECNKCIDEMEEEYRKMDEEYKKMMEEEK